MTKYPLSALIVLIMLFAASGGIERHEPIASVKSIMELFDQAAAISYVCEDNDNWQRPETTVSLGSGDCEDKALYLQYLLHINGYKSQVVFGVEDSQNSAKMHAWVETCYNGVNYVLDPTNGFIGRRENMASGRHMPVVGHPDIAKKLRNYRKKHSINRTINAHYEYILSENSQFFVAKDMDR